MSLAAHAPQTPLDALRGLLNMLARGESHDVAPLVGAVQAVGRPALPELGRCLGAVSAPRPVKKAILALVSRFDWPEWAGVLEGVLRTEGDLGSFDDAATALGALATRGALASLQRLLEARREPDRGVILGRELGFYQVVHPMPHYVARLTEGGSNARLAQQAAKALVAAAGPRDLPALEEVFRGGDDLSQRLVLRILGGMEAPEAGTWLLELLAGLRVEFLDNQQLDAVLTRVGALPRASAREAIQHLVVERFRDRDPETCTRMAQTSDQEEVPQGPFLDSLRTHAQGACDTFLLEALGLLLESKVARFNAFQAETSESLDRRQAQIQMQASSAAEQLAFRVTHGATAFEDAFPVLRAAFRSRLGHDALMNAYLSLVPAEDTAALDELLAEPEPSRRAKCLHALGAREEDALTPFFLRAMQDAIVDVGQLAVHHLGKLPSAFPALQARFESGQVEQMRLAIRVFAENRTPQAAELLLPFIQKEGRDDLLVGAVEALAGLKLPAALPTYLELLHDGKPLTLQVALVEALGALAQPEASLGILHKVAHLRQPEVLHLALEAVLAAFPDFEHPLPTEELPALMALVERCWDPREGEGQRLRTIAALDGLYVFDRKIYDTLKERFGDHLFAMRTQESWDRESNDKVAAAVKEMGRRSDNLGQLARRETELRGHLGLVGTPGSARMEALRAIKDLLGDSEMILRAAMSQEIAERIAPLLLQNGPDWRETALLCEVAGRCRNPQLVDPVRDIYQRATGVGLKSAARLALTALGLTAEAMERRPPVRTILLLEPSGFFRKRIFGPLAADGRWQVREAGSRSEAQALLEAAPVDLLISEAADGDGDLAEWLEARWEARQFRGLLLSTANREAASTCGGAKLVAALFKPFPVEALIDLLGV